jgi:hypothetical protein
MVPRNYTVDDAIKMKPETLKGPFEKMLARDYSKKIINRLLAAAMVFLSVGAVTGAAAQRRPDSGWSGASCSPHDGSCAAKAADKFQKIIERNNNRVNISKDEWMKTTLNDLIDQYPKWSVVLVANGLGGVQGCIHRHAEMPVFIGTTSVEIYFGKQGTKSCSVQHYGDGGWRNWAYGGWWTREGDRVYIR